MQIKKLESDIGLPLTEQIGKKISLTEAGTAFYLVSRDILDRMIHNMDDLYLIGKPPESSELEFQSYLANPMVVVAPVDHKLANRKSNPAVRYCGRTLHHA
jgi:DNA-binding transcriptional LysR family regulator